MSPAADRVTRYTRPLHAIAVGVAIWLVGSVAARAQTAPPDRAWTSNAALTDLRIVSDSTLGAGQGIAVRDGKIYAYGDVWSQVPRVGVIREYDLNLKPTGRAVWLRRDGKPLIVHPTGLTWDSRLGTFLGDTVKKKAVIYHLDWERAWADGNLDRAVLDVIDDDAAINGCRPTFVTVQGRLLLATADYGDARPEIRTYDPEPMLKARRTSAPGVVVHRVPSGPFNQNLYWDAATGRLTCVQNVIEGRGWQLETIDLEKAIAQKRTDADGARIQRHTFVPHDELEGFWPLDESRILLISSSPRDNLIIGTIRPRERKDSPAGARGFD
jgi:hypothetical protein